MGAKVEPDGPTLDVGRRAERTGWRRQAVGGLAGSAASGEPNRRSGGTLPTEWLEITLPVPADDRPTSSRGPRFFAFDGGKRHRGIWAAVGFETFGDREGQDDVSKVGFQVSSTRAGRSGQPNTSR